MSARLTKFSLRGFKTIKELHDFEPRDITVLIGPNGAGKSNLISFFRLLSWSLQEPGNLQMHVAQNYGGASNLLHGGASVTPLMESELEIDTDVGKNEYAFRLVHAAGDTLIFAWEHFRFSRINLPNRANWIELGSGHREAALIECAGRGDRTARVILSLLRKIIVYQFHNTSSNARMRNKWTVDDNRWLKEDAANIAPVLYRLQNDAPGYYQRIQDTIRLILPFFAHFVLEPEHGQLLLKWQEKNSDLVFSAGLAADGMLRLMALITLLLQPEEDLPDVLILDEPELGLHPFAITIIAGLLRAASKHVQILVATQSVSLIDNFEPEEIVVVERHGMESIFKRLDKTALQDWLEDYSISELWEKNVIGGRPE